MKDQKVLELTNEVRITRLLGPGLTINKARTACYLRVCVNQFWNKELPGDLKMQRSDAWKLSTQ